MKDKNLATYNSKKVVSWYLNLQGLMPVETGIFEAHAALIHSGNVLDIGIGGGRTISYLRRNSKNYTGIDYSEAFVQLVKKKYPDANYRVMDARDLSAFKTRSFDFVNFSFNGIDYVNLKDREQILKEVSRVLKTDGVFFFSTHNKNHISFNLPPWLDTRNTLMTRTKDFLKLLPYIFKKIQNKKFEIFTGNYAIINDSAHNYSLFTFYTAPDFLLKQLKEHSFAEVQFYNRSGTTVTNKTGDDWIFVTAKKTGP